MYARSDRNKPIRRDRRPRDLGAAEAGARAPRARAGGVAEEVFNAFIRARVASIGFERGIADEVVRALLPAKRLLLASLERIAAGGYPRGSEALRLAVLDAVNRSLAVAFASAFPRLERGARELAERQARLVSAPVMNAAAGALAAPATIATGSIARPVVAALRALADVRPLGAGLARWRAKFAFEIPDAALTALNRSLRAGRSVSQAVAGVRAVVYDATEADLRSLVRTTLGEVGVRVNEEVQRQFSSVAPFKQFTATLDDRTCPICAPLDGEVYRIDDERAPRIPTHINCFPAGVLVRASGVRLGYRRWYEGDLLVLRRSSGEDLPVTPNHPILTRRGWLAAAELREGDELIDGADLEGKLGSSPAVDADDEEIESAIENTASARGLVSLRVPVARPDFHGDGTDEEVDIEVFDRLLSNVPDAAGFQGARETVLFDVEELGSRLLLARERATATDRERDGLSSDGGVRRRGQAQATLPVEPRHPQEHRLGAVAGFDVHRDQAFSDASPVAAEMARASLLAQSGEVEATKLLGIDRKFSFRGHVFNLETARGYYTANGVAVANCRCDYVPVIPEEPFPERVRASGTPATRPDVPARRTFRGWLRGQPPEVQREVLGLTRWRLWRSGALALEDFVASGEVLTLDDLAARYGGIVADTIRNLPRRLGG